MNPLEVLGWYDNLPVPDPITFVLSEHWLDKPNLYPRQATLLKIIFLRDDLFTDYDHQVIAEWINDFNETNPDAGVENKFTARTNGIQPDVYERIAWLKAHNYRWFREVILAIGRRGAKGYVSSLAMAYVLWNYLAKGNPQEYYGIDPNKQLSAMIFASKREQAKENLWGDLYNVITTAPCFTEYISAPLAESLTVYAPYDFVRMRKMAARGIRTTRDMASFSIVPRESTLVAPRGQAGFLVGFDEAAHVKNAGITREFGAVYNAATPSLDQFGTDAFIILPSSTWEMTGRFYELWELSLQRELHDDQLMAVYQNKLMLQLPSWGPYKDWERAHELEIFPPGFTGDLQEHAEVPRFRKLRGAIQAYDDNMRKEERANPDAFRVERLSNWATAMDAYLAAARVDGMFADWGERHPDWGPPHLENQVRGPLLVSYRAHGDPSNVNCRFGFALAHEEPGPDGLNHAVFDLIHFWDPADYDDHFVDYDEIIEWIYSNVVTRFQPDELTFDQFNAPATVQALQKRVRAGHLQKNVQVYVRDATAALNWSTYETFKACLNMGLVHAPVHMEAAQELKFLQKPEGQSKVICPTSGPVQTKDIADCVAIVTAALLGEQMGTFLGRDLARQRPGLSLPGGDDPYKRFDPGQFSNPFGLALGQSGMHRGLHSGMGRTGRPGAGYGGRGTSPRRMSRS
jgi:hypothetical protein